MPGIITAVPDRFYWVYPLGPTGEDGYLAGGAGIVVTLAVWHITPSAPSPRLD